MGTVPGNICVPDPYANTTNQCDPPCTTVDGCLIGPAQGNDSTGIHELYNFINNMVLSNEGGGVYITQIIYAYFSYDNDSLILQHTDV